MREPGPTRYGYAVPCARIEIMQVAHLVPDEKGLIASQRMAAVQGPSVGHPTNCADALTIMRRYRIALPQAVRAVLEWAMRYLIGIG